MHDFHTAHPRTLNANNMDHEARIQAAITDLESQERVNYAATAKKWNIDRSTLSRRHRGETGSNQDANSYARRQLTDTQEKTLIQYINKLSNRGLPPTPQIVKNLAEEICNNPRIITKTATRPEQEDTVARTQRTRWPEIDGHKGVLQTL